MIILNDDKVTEMIQEIKLICNRCGYLMPSIDELHGNWEQRTILNNKITSASFTLRGDCISSSKEIKCKHCGLAGSIKIYPIPSINTTSNSKVFLTSFHQQKNTNKNYNRAEIDANTAKEIENNLAFLEEKKAEIVGAIQKHNNPDLMQRLKSFLFKNKEDINHNLSLLEKNKSEVEDKIESVKKEIRRKAQNKEKTNSEKAKREVKKSEKSNPLDLKDKIYTVPEFAAIIRRKFDSYPDLPDAILVENILKKFPMYSDKISNQEVEQSEEDKQRELKAKEHPLRLSESNEKLIHQLFIDSQDNMQNEDYSNAIKSLSKIIKIAEKQRDLSEEDPKPIIGYTPADQSYVFNIVDLYYLRASAKFASGNKDALNDFNSALSINPDHTEALYNRAVFYNNENNDQENALKDIQKCLSLKPDDKDFIKFHNDLINSDDEKMSENEFLRIQKLYNDSFFHFSPINYLSEDDAPKEQAIITSHFNTEFNNYYNTEDGVVWDKIKDGYVTMSPSDELISDIVALSNYHKNKICDLIIDIICANGEIQRNDMMRLFLFLQNSGASIDEVPLRDKWENKIGYFPDVRDWDENEPIKL